MSIGKNEFNASADTALVILIDNLFLYLILQEELVKIIFSKPLFLKVSLGIFFVLFFFSIYFY